MRSKKIICIVDDQNLFRSIYRVYIKQHFDLQDIEIYEFENGCELLDELLRNNLSLACIILDIEMPGINGIEVLQNLRHASDLKKYKKVPVVLSTGTLTEVIKYNALVNKAELFMKPYGLHKLYGLLKKFIS